jgi:FkbM family methyltransferase
MNAVLSRAAQEAIILITRPYVRFELPGWGRVFGLVAGYRRDWLWRTGAHRTIIAKTHGYSVPLDLSLWPDRATYFLGRWYDLEAQLLLKHLVRPGDTVLDIGANRGDFALCASHLAGAAGHVICFEPNPRCRAWLARTIELNRITNIHQYPFGLGSRDEDLVLSIPKINSGEATFGQSSYAETEHVVCQVKCGDLVLGNSPPKLIKIDVEGFELNVISGLSKTIEKHRPVVLMEMIAAHQKACGSSIDALKSRMLGFGYIGFKIHLERHLMRHRYSLTKLDESSGDCDAIWVHGDAIPDALRSAIIILW